MNHKRLFQYAVLFHEYETNKEGVKAYKDSKVIIQPTIELGLDDKEIAFKATRLIPEEYASPENIEIVVRPF